MIIEGMMSLLASSKMLPKGRYPGACTSDATYSTAFRLNHSYCNAFCCKVALSNTLTAPSSDSSMQHPGSGTIQ